jgi:hypothetical protein
MYGETRNYGRGTSITVRSPWGLYVSAKALCSDGKVRTVSRISITADTFFSVPAAVTVYKNGARRTVSGYITFETLTGMSTETEGDPMVVKFHRYSYGKNADALPMGAYREHAVHDCQCPDCYSVMIDARIAARKEAEANQEAGN